MRHDLPKRIQLHAPVKRWYHNEHLREAIEIVVLFAAFMAAAKVVMWAMAL